jgi:molecular chaperone HtpG
MGKVKDELGDLQIEVVVNKEAKTLHIIDNGIGMDQAEVEKYINQIAFSGAEEFVNKYKDKTDGANMIGHFGLGFYSSFMVAEKVELLTRSYKKTAKAVRWECDGSPKYKIEPADKKERGTEVILHIAEDSVDFLEDSKISELLSKYCKFLPVEIKFGTKTDHVPDGKDKEGKEKTKEVVSDNIVNNVSPAWKKQPSKLKDEDYQGFYRELYPYSFEEPLFNIHLNVDYPFNLTGILYFPRLKNKVEIQKDKIQLYCNQVFVTDSVEGIVPDFLTLLHGVIDSPDIPLNISRSFLQSDARVKQISSHISKKVADKLDKLFKKDRKDFEAKWDDIKIFIEYGMLAEDKFYDKGTKFCLFKNTESEFFTMEEYEKKIKKTQMDKNKKLVYLYANNAEEEHSYIQAARDRGYDVLLMDSALSAHFIGRLEQKLTDVSFVRVDADTIDQLIDKDEEQTSKLTEKDQDKLKPVIEGIVPKEKFSVVFKSMSEKDQPMSVTEPEFARRMKDMNEIGGGGMMGMGAMPDMFTLVVNSNHPIIGKILKEKDKKKQKHLAKQTADLALLAKNMLKGEELTKFVQRSLKHL